MVEPAQLGLHFYVVTSGTIIRAVCWREGQRTVTMDTTTVRPRCSASLSLYLPSDFDRGFENVQCKVTNPPVGRSQRIRQMCASCAQMADHDLRSGEIAHREATSRTQPDNGQRIAAAIHSVVSPRLASISTSARYRLISG